MLSSVRQTLRLASQQLLRARELRQRSALLGTTSSRPLVARSFCRCKTLNGEDRLVVGSSHLAIDRLFGTYTQVAKHQSVWFSRYNFEKGSVVCYRQKKKKSLHKNIVGKKKIL